MRNIENQTIIEELINSITHGVGLALSVIGFIVLVTLSILHGTAWQIAGCAVFGLTLIFLYTASTLYHSLRTARAKRVFKVVDHAAIYLLIAGTYTPFTLVNLRGFWGWTLFGLIWTLTILGIAFKIFFIDKFKILSALVYIVMGWLGLVAFKPLLEMVPLAGIIWLLAGGLFYTTGVIFFASKHIPYSHAIWHVFVMAGSICHYFAVFFSVLQT
ncbi:MAG TPA: hemolysin III family protein [Blastocatellia bacterium]|nr:hemolysin III family protein [Blastocatellia bacterium]